MAEDINKVRHVIEIDPHWAGRDRSSEVNDYLSLEGWILLSTAKHSGTGDSGDYSWVSYVVGWIGEGDPNIPPVRSFPPA